MTTTNCSLGQNCNYMILAPFKTISYIPLWELVEIFWKSNAKSYVPETKIITLFKTRILITSI